LLKNYFSRYFITCVYKYITWIVVKCSSMFSPAENASAINIKSFCDLEMSGRTSGLINFTTLKMQWWFAILQQTVGWLFDCYYFFLRRKLHKKLKNLITLLLARKIFFKTKNVFYTKNVCVRRIYDVSASNIRSKNITVVETSTL